MAKKNHSQLPSRRVNPHSKPQVLERIEPNAPAPRRGLDRNRIMFFAVIGVVAGQLFLPAHQKPFRLAGEAAAQFHGALFDEVNRKDLELAQQQAVARKMADLQAEYATWKGLCSLTAAFDPTLGAACMQAADAHFQSALKQIRNSELLYR